MNSTDGIHRLLFNPLEITWKPYQFNNSMHYNYNMQLQLNLWMETVDAEWIHIFLRQNLAIKIHDGGKEGHLRSCGGISIHLSLTAFFPMLGQSTSKIH